MARNNLGDLIRNWQLDPTRKNLNRLLIAMERLNFSEDKLNVIKLIFSDLSNESNVMNNVINQLMPEKSSVLLGVYVLVIAANLLPTSDGFDNSTKAVFSEDMQALTHFIREQSKQNIEKLYSLLDPDDTIEEQDQYLIEQDILFEKATFKNEDLFLYQEQIPPRLMYACLRKNMKAAIQDLKIISHTLTGLIPEKELQKQLRQNVLGWALRCFLV